tara:strand:- start:173 stop:610 length:438 start_codon:yes stop_codon:yes gene_type:complete
MDILIPFINWVIVFILQKTFIKKYFKKHINSYYSLPINYLLLINFIKDNILFFITIIIYYNGLESKEIFPQNIIQLINWILVFILSKSIFELFICMFAKKFSHKIQNIAIYVKPYVQNFTVEKSLFRSLLSIPWIILTYFIYHYT